MGNSADSTSPPTAASELAVIEQQPGSPWVDPHLRPFFESWLDTFIYNGRLDPQLREFTILRVMWRCGQAFEWGNHYRFARKSGITRDEVLAIRTSDPRRDLEGAVATVVCAADEIVDVGHLSEAVMVELRDLFPDPGLLDEFLYLVAGYRMFAAISASKRDGYGGSHAPWPPDGVAPTES